MKTLVALLALLMTACSLPPKTQAALESDWRLAESIRGDRASPLHQKFFGPGPVDGKKYAAFFSERVREVRGEGILYASCHGALACDGGGGVVRISDRYDGKQVPAVVRLSLLLHEARHVEGAEHVECPKKPLISPYQRADLSELNECDADETGAYGTQWVMLTNIANYCESCDPSLRAQAREYSDFLIQLILSSSARQRLLADESP